MKPKHAIKPLLISGFFLLFSGISIADTKGQSDEFWREWSAILYFIDGEFKINNPRFLLSYEDPSPASELQMYLRYLKQNERVCKYPARYQILVKYNLALPSLPICEELGEYEAKAPTDEFKYIYASESLSSIAGMMGHGFIMGEGKNNQGEMIQHSFSFYTDLRTANQFTLALDAFVFGMDGIFALRPYSRDLQRYLNAEERDIWELTLKLNSYQTLLLRNALWELKDVRPQYLFQSFNCATLTLYTLSIIEPRILDYEILFVTPLDIFKGLLKTEMVRKTVVKTPQRIMPSNPANKLQDSIFSLSVNKNGLNLSFVPASHYMRTVKNNTSSELLIGAFELNLPEKQIENITLYNLTSLNDQDNAFSKSIDISWERGEIGSSWNMSYNIGYTYNLQGVRFSVLPGISYSTHNSKINFNNKVFISKLLFSDIKMVYSLESQSYQDDSSSKTQSFTVSKRLNDSIVYLKLEEDGGSKIFEVGYDYHF